MNQGFARWRDSTHVATFVRLAHKSRNFAKTYIPSARESTTKHTFCFEISSHISKTYKRFFPDLIVFQSTKLTSQHCTRNCSSTSADFPLNRKALITFTLSTVESSCLGLLCLASGAKSQVFCLVFDHPLSRNKLLNQHFESRVYKALIHGPVTLLRIVQAYASV